VADDIGRLDGVGFGPRAQPKAVTSGRMPRVVAESRHPLRLPRLCAFALGVGIAYTACSYEADLNVRGPAVLRVSAPQRSRARGPATRVVWVLVDGLRLDASREMTVLNWLRAEGEDVSARAEFPTYSGPNFVAQASGIEPAASGVQTNGYSGEVALDSVFRRAKMAGLRTAVLATDPDPGLSGTYGSWVDESDIDDTDLRLPPMELVFAHIEYVDAAAHASGSASPQYRAAVARADEAIGRIVHTLDPVREVLIVTSDHGNLDIGGHGGSEREVARIPIVIWGAGAVRRTRAGRGRDVGPTIASLLGIGPLSHATGRPLVRGDAVTSRQRAAARAAVCAAGPLPVDFPIAIPIAVVALLVLGAASRPEVRPLMSSPTYALVFAGLLLVTHTLSFSVSNDGALFSARLIVMSSLAALAQLRLGGRSSLVPSALVASLAVLWTTVMATHRPLTPADGTLHFLPIPALAGLAFICLMTAVVGGRSPEPGTYNRPKYTA
jgi:phosphopentomutase/2,3-bisphosphoglycerate-independent phosphoglycerate mutase family metalloenzyme